MLESYRLMHRNLHIGNLSYDRQLDKFYYVSVIDKSIKPTTKEYPLGLFPATLVGTVDKNHRGKVLARFVPNLGRNPGDHEIREWLSERVMPENRQNIEAVLRKIGFSHYDLWDLTKYTKSMCYEDNYWLSNNVLETYENTHIRYLTESGNLSRMKQLKEAGVLPAY
jgi:hypothetical protein